MMPNTLTFRLCTGPTNFLVHPYDESICTLYNVFLVHPYDESICTLYNGFLVHPYDESICTLEWFPGSSLRRIYLYPKMVSWFIPTTNSTYQDGTSHSLTTNEPMVQTLGLNIQTLNPPLWYH